MDRPRSGIDPLLAVVRYYVTPFQDAVPGQNVTLLPSATGQSVPDRRPPYQGSVVTYSGNSGAHWANDITRFESGTSQQVAGGSLKSLALRGVHWLELLDQTMR